MGKDNDNKLTTVKAFDYVNGQLVCRGFVYEVGKTYEAQDDVSLCSSGFHASANNDISDTVFYYPNVLETAYAVVELDVVSKGYFKAVGNKIKIVQLIETLDEKIQYDKTGLWSYIYAYFLSRTDGYDVNKIQQLKESVIQKDSNGKLCYFFATNVLNLSQNDVLELQNAIINKDETGEYCYSLAKSDIDNLDKEALQNCVISKDTTGQWCSLYARDIQDADINALQQAVIEKDHDGLWKEWFAYNVDGANKQLLLD